MDDGFFCITTHILGIGGKTTAPPPFLKNSEEEEEERRNLDAGCGGDDDDDDDESVVTCVAVSASPFACGGGDTFCDETGSSFIWSPEILPPSTALRPSDS